LIRLSAPALPSWLLPIQQSSTVTQLRPFRNTDPPALAKLWNQAVREPGVAVPLRVPELDTHALGTVNFEAHGLIVAEKEGRIAGFVHAGFGPRQPLELTQPFEICHELGTIAMLAVEPEPDDRGLVSELIIAAEAYLRSRGAKVIYAGSLFPLNPFYWGLYGGSEGSGVLTGQQRFRQSLLELGYIPAATTVLLELDLAVEEARDPRAILLRRQFQVEFLDDALPGNWWQNLALGDYQMLKARLLSKAGGTEIANLRAWDMGCFSRGDSRPRIGLIDLEVMPEHRRKGCGRFIVTEMLGRARENGIAAVAVQTSAENQPALSLYASLGFQRVNEATLYRLPAEVVRGR
jgi:ribosomal protein S18 acetylase RimI-like enzyme